MELTFFTSMGWESWDIEARPVIPERMPVLVDDDLMFDGDGGPRPSVAVNRWLRELPVSGAPVPGTWAVYARVLRAWMVFCSGHGTGVFAGREELRASLGAYAAYRAEGPEQARFEATTWNRHVSVLSSFYQWAVAEGYAGAVPFSYAQAQVRYGDVRRDAQVNLARRRVPHRHVTIRYLEADFAELFIAALGGLGPDGMPDGGYRGRELARNAAVGKLALASGLRRQEFSYLLAYEVPPLPPSPAQLPVPFPVPAGVTKGRKYRTTWTDHASLEAVHQYAGLDRAAVTDGSPWRPPQKWGRAAGGERARCPRGPGQRAAGPVGSAGSGAAAVPGRAGRRVVPAGGPLRWWAVHGVGERVHACLGPDPAPFRTAVPACSSSPAASHFRSGDFGTAGQRLLRAGCRAGDGDRPRQRPGCGASAVSGQGGSDDGAA